MGFSIIDLFCQVWDCSLSNQSMPGSEIHEYGVGRSLGLLSFVILAVPG